MKFSLLLTVVCAASKLTLACRSYFPEIRNIENIREPTNDTNLNNLKDILSSMEPVDIISYLLKMGMIRKQDVSASRDAIKDAIEDACADACAETCSNATAGVWSPDLIPDSAMTASSEYHSNSLAKYGRIGDTRVGGGYGWLARSTNRAGEWLQVDLGRPMRVTGIIAGGSTSGHYSQSFKIQYAEDPGSFKTIADEDGNDKVFPGLTAARTKKTTYFPQPFVARYVRYVTGSGHAAVKLEYLVC